MKKLNYFGKIQTVYYEKANNGLDVYVLPNNKQEKYTALLVVKYGSDINEVKLVGDSEFKLLPSGIAHFLEHKAFDMNEGNPFDFFGQYATFVNASTSFNSTKYYIEGKKKAYDNIDYLIKMVFSPYFTEDSVNNEKSIIGEEIKMYEDDVEWVLDLKAREGLFQNIFVGNIGGSIESINEIDANILTKVYETFYQPSNMFLVVSGKVSPKKIIDLVNSNKVINEHKTRYPIEILQKKEEKQVVLEYQEIYGLIKNPKLRYSYKFDLNDFMVIDHIKLKWYLNLLFTFLFGSGSYFDEEIITKHLATSFYDDYMIRDNIYTISFFAESDYGDLFVDLVDKTMENINITEEDFNRIKKLWYSIIIRSTDNIVNVANSLVDDLLRDEKCYDNFDYIEKLDYHELLEIIHKLDLSNKSLVFLLPKEGK